MLFCQMSMKIFSFHYLITVDRWILKAGAASKVQAVESDKSFAAVFSLAQTPPIFSCFSRLTLSPNCLSREPLRICMLDLKGKWPQLCFQSSWRGSEVRNWDACACQDFLLMGAGWLDQEMFNVQLEPLFKVDHLFTGGCLRGSASGRIYFAYAESLPNQASKLDLENMGGLQGILTPRIRHFFSCSSVTKKPG